MSSDFRFSNLIHLLRALFPSWNFFDRIAYQFTLQIRTSSSLSLSGWKKIDFTQRRRLFHLFINADTNLALAQISIIEHFARDIQEPSIAERLVSFKMLRSLIEEKLQAGSQKYEKFQFKLAAENPHETIEIYTSEWLKMEPS